MTNKEGHVIVLRCEIDKDLTNKQEWLLSYVQTADKHKYLFKLTNNYVFSVEHFSWVGVTNIITRVQWILYNAEQVT